jgi:D-alanine-D-alanine ligase
MATKRNGKRKKRKLRVLVLLHADLVPPDDLDNLSEEKRYQMRTEVDVITALKKLGHEPIVVGVHDDLGPVRQIIQEQKPHVAFNLLEEFRGEAAFDYNLVAYLEALGLPYTGCNPRGLIIARDKALSKKVVSYHRSSAPKFVVFRKGRKITLPKKLGYPLIVKSLTADSSTGISEASVVRSDDKLIERVEFIHRTVQTHAIVEQYIDGRELYVTVMGHTRLRTLPAWELSFDELRSNAPRIATSRVKWDQRYQERRGLYVQEAELEEAEQRRLAHTSKRIFRALRLSGYARIDYRMQPDGKLFFLEANPNPDIQQESEAAGGALSAGLKYHDFIGDLLRLGLRALD